MRAAANLSRAGRKEALSLGRRRAVERLLETD